MSLQAQRFRIKFMRLPPGRNRHHLTPKNVFKRRHEPVDNSDANLLLIDIEKHDAWHVLFKEKTLDEAIDLLVRLRRMKQIYKEAA